MSSPTHAFRREGENPMITPAAVRPTFAGADMAVDEQARFFAPSLSPDGSHEHVVALASVGDEAAKGAGVPSSEVEVDDTNITSPIVPEVGMAFKSEADAYEFYNEYAGKIGFSIRKSHSRLRPDKSVYQKHIVCSNEGERGTHSKHDTMKPNATTRSGCDARINSNDSGEDVTNSNITFKAPRVIKGPMEKRAKGALEKKGPKKSKYGTKKPKTGPKKGAGNKVKENALVGEGHQQFTGSNEAITRTNIAMPQFTNNMFYAAGPQQFTGPFVGSTGTGMAMPQFTNNMIHAEGSQQFTGSFGASSSFNTTVPHFTNNTFHGDTSTMFGPFIQGGYTELLLQTDRALDPPQTSRRLDFDEMNPGGRKE